MTDTNRIDWLEKADPGKVTMILMDLGPDAGKRSLRDRIDAAMSAEPRPDPRKENWPTDFRC